MQYTYPHGTIKTANPTRQADGRFEYFIRRDNYTDLQGNASVCRYHAAGPDDHSQPNQEYHWNCSYCYLNISHTEQAHTEAMQKKEQ